MPEEKTNKQTKNVARNIRKTVEELIQEHEGWVHAQNLKQDFQ